MRHLKMGLALTAAALLAACGDRPQEMGAAGKAKGSAPSWQGTTNGNAAPGWKAGDEQSWEEQMRRRAQNQNEYTRTAGNG